ncbi:MAG: transporter substrate-binding domain-containing protein, partial [Treponema sp.]|nr:transporter substrate-binding domain-containing protein [Treponema sp.]
MKKIIGVLLAVAIIASFMSCNRATGKLKKVQSAGKIVVYTDPNFPPFEFIGRDQAVIGVDIEIARAIAQELGVTLEIQEATFDSIIT